ncbi:hypothetical protein PCANC_11128 [Puccinia coronata f. sp. avenae]|uniref:Kinase n=1 Tax=Puccinia coronata f. sp. avenae TaxID=200324 RepID=A0A2N5V8X0_9BASI|nr:hypothetical protein PCANC_11128 [Puccinia coronata f. sp. avenae]
MPLLSLTNPHNDPLPLQFPHDTILHHSYPTSSDSEIDIGGAKSLVSSNVYDGQVKFIPQGVEVKPCSVYKKDASQEESAEVFPFPIAGGHLGGIRLDPEDPSRLIKDTYRDEAFFYQNLAPELDNTLEKPWDGWRPHYYEWKKRDGEWRKKALASVIMENVAQTTSSKEYDQDSELFWHPNVIDVKLGTKLSSDSEESEKKDRKETTSKNTTSGKFAMRLSGAEYWDNEKQEYKKESKKYGHTVEPLGIDLQEKFNALFPLSVDKGKQIEGSLLTFSPGGLTPEMMKLVLDSLVPQLEKLLAQVSQLKWRSPATSLLVVFEGDARRLEKVVQSNPQISAKLADVRLIDFAYTEAHDGVDEELVLGLKNTLKCFHELRRMIENLEL